MSWAGGRLATIPLHDSHFRSTPSFACRSDDYDVLKDAACADLSDDLQRAVQYIWGPNGIKPNDTVVDVQGFGASDRKNNVHQWGSNGVAYFSLSDQSHFPQARGT